MTSHRQRGQALTEFLCAAVAVMPLFLLIPMIGKYQDISNSTQMAARYVAFEGTVRNDSTGSFKSEAELTQDVVRRFFSNADAPIKTYDAAGNFKANQNLFWRDPVDKPLIADFGSDVAVTTSFTNIDGETKPFDPVDQQIGLKTRGVYTANVSVTLANVPNGLKFYEPFDRIDLSMTRSTSIVLDPWTAKDPAQVESRIAGSPVIFPAGNLSGVTSIVDAAVTIIDLPGGISGPKLGQLDFWRDVVPKDRLGSSQ